MHQAPRATLPLVTSSLAAPRARTDDHAELVRREFTRRYASLERYLVRLCGDPATAADIAQEAFARLHQRGTMPDDAGAWLVTVAHNLLRNSEGRRRRRERLSSPVRAAFVVADPPLQPDAEIEAAERRARVRAALERLPLRDRQLLLLRYEGMSYRELSRALRIGESSVGTLLARAKGAFRHALGEDSHARD